MLVNADAFFEAAIINLEDMMETVEEMLVRKRHSETDLEKKQTQSKPDLGEGMSKLEREVQDMRMDIGSRRFYDSMLTARV
jgi:hypothetical protein